MMDLTKWLPLWKLAPELEPEGLEYNPNRGRRWTIRIRDQSARGWSSPIDEKTAAALIGWKAMLVGGQKWNFVLLHCGKGWWVEYLNGATDFTEYFADPLEALRLAVCKVLGVEP